VHLAGQIFSVGRSARKDGVGGVDRQKAEPLCEDQVDERGASWLFSQGKQVLTIFHFKTVKLTTVL